ncbi:MAG: DUF5615 family PIN-like protein [Terracidiphilus sp.]
MKLLIDECLSTKLVEIARQRGNPESSHVVWLGKSGWKDWKLKDFVIEGDWTFVTRNSVDFRGSHHNPGSKGLYANVELHAGLICLNGPVGMARDQQLELFNRALDEIDLDPFLMNQVLEVTFPGTAREIEILRYKLPKE